MAVGQSQSQDLTAFVTQKYLSHIVEMQHRRPSGFEVLHFELESKFSFPSWEYLCMRGRLSPNIGAPGTSGHIHRLTNQSRSPRAERVRSFWEGPLTHDLHLCQGSPYGLSDQPCERQTRAPIHGIAQTIYEITGETDR
jgi:hypothetical protein